MLLISSRSSQPALNSQRTSLSLYSLRRRTNQEAAQPSLSASDSATG